jgi:hypothetical protein
MDEESIPDTIWVEYVNAKDGRPYYYNKETKLTTYTLPPDYVAWREPLIRKYLKTSVWGKAEAKGKVYYYDKVIF